MPNRISDEELLLEIKNRLQDNKKYLEVVETLNTDIKALNKKLEESESLKSHFISNIANEIINPLTSIIGISEAILSIDKENWKKVISMVALIHSEVFSLDFQFRNIFMAAKLEAGQGSPEIFKVDMNNLVESVIESFKIDLKKKKLSINYVFNTHNGNDNIFRTDPDKLKLVISNLLSNAIKFSFEESVIDITATLGNNNFVISVKDYGIGISSENKKIIFDRFNNIESGINTSNRGHGLGLSINKAIIDMLNGTIQIESEKGKGSCFTCSFPETDIPAIGYSFNANESYFNSTNDTELF